MSELPDFLGGEAEIEAPIAEIEVADGPVRGPDGKFAAVEAAPEPVIEAVIEPTPNVVPLATFLDTRDRLNAAEKRAKELETWRAQQEAAARAQPVPDPVEDPQAYEKHRQATIDQAMFAQNLNFSRRIATVEHGAQVVDAAYQWGVERCDADPHFNAKVRASNDPVGLVVAEWRRDQIASKVDPSDYDAFLAWKAGNPNAAPTTAQPPPRPTAPRPSLASGPSAGMSGQPEALDGEATFGTMFVR